MWKLIKKAKRCVWWVIIRKIVCERKHLYSNMALSVPLYSILKRRICCCYLYLWIHAIWPSVKWWVIPAQQEELVLNLQSPIPARLPPHLHLSLPILPPPPSLLIAHAWICWIWMEVEGREEERGTALHRDWKNVSLTEVASVTSFSPKEMWHKN